MWYVKTSFASVVLAEGRGNAPLGQESAQGRGTTPVTNGTREWGDGASNRLTECIKGHLLSHFVRGGIFLLCNVMLSRNIWNLAHCLCSYLSLSLSLSLS